MSGRLIVVCGLPGSGKSTLAADIASRVGAIRLCSDEWIAGLGGHPFDDDLRGRVERLQLELAEQLLVAGGTVIIEWGTCLRVERERLRIRARALGADVELRVLDPPVDKRWEQVRARNATVPVDQRLRLEHLHDHQSSWQPPDADELALYDTPIT